MSLKMQQSWWSKDTSGKPHSGKKIRQERIDQSENPISSNESDLIFFSSRDRLMKSD